MPPNPITLTTKNNGYCDENMVYLSFGREEAE
jgi:hypothetical protein